MSTSTRSSAPSMSKMKERSAISSPVDRDHKYDYTCGHMVRRRIEVEERAAAELAVLRAFDQGKVRAAIRDLANNALVPTKHRKPLRDLLAPAWQVTVGAFRVLYVVEGNVVRVFRVIRKGRKTT